ncbi:CidA/LrgA family holin-like protein [Bacillus cereus group sp. BfR-BA-01380]|uniref:CidA/LrgA family holin-like protein n=1 Tax=Bacillus cereus group sp. BfR-BA-01380 TaxID=2920324 RepID=UPI001F570924|nr:CidA/LrgA family holin-like protein [Bacillus cereus group sp. BfR-BA-01380]
MKACKLCGQILLLFCFAWIGEWITKVSHLPIPGSIIGIFLLLISLKCNLVKKEWIASGADFLLKELILFFIPSAIAVIRYKDILVQYGIDIIFIIISSTLCVTLVTGVLTDFLLKRKGQTQ